MTIRIRTVALDKLDLGHLTSKISDIVRVCNDGLQDICLEEISDGEKAGKKYIGVAHGVDIGHCVSLAMRHEKSFYKAKWYYLIKADDEGLQRFKKKTMQLGSIGVEFYRDPD